MIYDYNKRFINSIPSLITLSHFLSVPYRTGWLDIFLRSIIEESIYWRLESLLPGDPDRGAFVSRDYLRAARGVSSSKFRWIQLGRLTTWLLSQQHAESWTRAKPTGVRRRTTRYGVAITRDHHPRNRPVRRDAVTPRPYRVDARASLLRNHRALADSQGRDCGGYRMQDAGKRAWTRRFARLDEERSRWCRLANTEDCTSRFAHPSATYWSHRNPNILICTNYQESIFFCYISN